ncbi:MAG: protein TolR [Alphaproteobacteria bacterium]
MGASFSKAGNRSKGRRKFQAMSEINVTPMVDVMLVLLVIFMVAAPLMTTGVPVDLPGSNAPALPEQKDPLMITLTQEGKLFLQETEVPSAALVARLKAITGVNPDAPVYIRADQTLAYGQVMELMGLIRQGGYTKVALISEPAGSKPKLPVSGERVKSPSLSK